MIVQSSLCAKLCCRNFRRLSLIKCVHAGKEFDDVGWQKWVGGAVTRKFESIPQLSGFRTMLFLP